jgi:hypothetical protein
VNLISANAFQSSLAVDEWALAQVLAVNAPSCPIERQHLTAWHVLRDAPLVVRCIRHTKVPTDADGDGLATNLTLGQGASWRYVGIRMTDTARKDGECLGLPQSTCKGMAQRFWQHVFVNIASHS